MNMDQLVVRNEESGREGAWGVGTGGGVSARGLFRQTWNGWADMRGEISSTRTRPRNA